MRHYIHVCLILSFSSLLFIQVNAQGLEKKYFENVDRNTKPRRYLGQSNNQRLGKNLDGDTGALLYDYPDEHIVNYMSIYLDRFDEENDDEDLHGNPYTRFTNSSNPVDYGDNHPFEIIRRRRHRRKLYESDVSEPNNTMLTKQDKEEDDEFKSFYERHLAPWDANAQYKPIRIHLDTKFLTLVKQNYGPEVQFLENNLLPKVKSVWEAALRVYPVQNNLAVTSKNCPISASYQNSTGIQNTDLVVYVAANIESICATATEPLVAATSCQYDNYDRPTVGRATICLQDFDMNDQVSVNNLFKLLLHGIAHILGFSHKDYQFFYDPKTGEPRTKRPFQQSSVTCVDGGQQYRVVPSDTTIKPGFTSRGLRYFEMVTPTVKAMVRNHFNCQSMTGARLENQPTNNGNCFGSHWEAVS